MAKHWMLGVVATALVAGIGAGLSGCVPLIAAGVGSAVLVADDRRTAGAVLEDERLQTRVLIDAKNKFPDGTHLNVVSYNRVILLTGEVFDEAMKAGVEAIAKAQVNVRGVHNELRVAPVANLGSVSIDTGITTKIKTRFMGSKNFQANHVKVVTEAATVYLLGLVKRAEADEATEIARVDGQVRRVVRLFEYLD